MAAPAWVAGVGFSTRCALCTWAATATVHGIPKGDRGENPGVVLLHPSLVALFGAVRLVRIQRSHDLQSPASRLGQLPAAPSEHDKGFFGRDLSDTRAPSDSSQEIHHRGCG